MAQKLFSLFWAYMYVLIYYNTCMSILVDIYIGSCFRGEKMFFRDVGCQLLACLDGKVGWRRWKK